MEFVDIAGLVRGASRGEGLGNKFLSHIRECDAIVHVVRCFEDENIVHVEGSVDPARDTVAVVTNDFHIARSELIAARQGFGDTIGIPAQLPWAHLEINYHLREAFALVKTFLFD